MRALQKWFTGSSMSWAGLRWGAAGLSLMAHGAAASLAWVMIEVEPATEPTRVIEAFTVELISVDQKQGAATQKPTISAAVPTHQATIEMKMDLVRGRVSAPSAPASKDQLQQKPQHKIKKEEIKLARATPMPEYNLPKAVLPTVTFPRPLYKPLHKPLQKTAVKKNHKQQKEKPGPVVIEPIEQKPKSHQTSKAVKLASRSPASQGGTGSGKTRSKGEAVPMTAASYTLGSLGNKPPEYPERARRNEFEGRIVLRVRVSPEGKSETVAVQNSSGYKLLDEAALAAVKDWRFLPAQRAGRAVASTIDVPITFRLTGNP